MLLQEPRLGEDVAHREHAQRADLVGLRALQEMLARVLVHQVEGQHEHLPDRLLHGALQHDVLGIARGGLGDGEMAQLALLLLAQEGGDDLRHGPVVELGPQPVQVEDVDMVGVESAQRGLQVGDHGGCRERARAVERVDVGLGGDHHALARAALDGLADDALRAVADRRVDEVDAEVERPLHQRDRLRLGETGAEPDAAVTAAAEPRHAHLRDPSCRAWYSASASPSGVRPCGSDTIAQPV